MADEQYRAWLNSTTKHEIDGLIRRVRWSALTQEDQADIMEGIAAYVFGAAIAARGAVNPDVKASEIVMTLVTRVRADIARLEEKGPLDG